MKWVCEKQNGSGKRIEQFKKPEEDVTEYTEKKILRSQMHCQLISSLVNWILYTIRIRIFFTSSI